MQQLYLTYKTTTMDTSTKNLTKEEKENVLLVLNEFSEDHKQNTKAINNLISSVKEYTAKINPLLERVEDQSKTEPAVIEELKNTIATGINKMQEAIQRFSFPDAKLHHLSNKLDKNMELLKNPIPQKIIHQHHVPQITWMAVGLLIALALVSAGWYMTASKLDGYIANDTKYRYLKLDTGHVILQRQFYQADSMLNANANLRDSVIRVEEQYRYNFELLQKASRMNAEAEKLKAKAKVLKEQASRK